MGASHFIIFNHQLVGNLTVKRKPTNRINGCRFYRISASDGTRRLHMSKPENDTTSLTTDLH